MARSSRERVDAAISRESMSLLRSRALQAPPAPPLRLCSDGFDVIAEIKLRSPAAGRLGSHADDWLGRAQAYCRGGAAAVSVLTEPSRFDGTLQHLQQAASAIRAYAVPVMRKDFLVDPYQVAEARAAGAGGVLLIIRMLTRQLLQELLNAAAEFGLFVLLEAFDAEDLRIAEDSLRETARLPPQVLIGINSRDLQTLEVVAERFELLAPFLPGGWPAVAESGVSSAADARRMLQLGYRCALIGTALMGCGDPAALLTEIFEATRTVKS